MAALSPRHRWMVSQIITVFNLAEHEPLVENLFRNQFSHKVDTFLKGTSAAQHLLFSYQGETKPPSPAGNIEGKLVCTEEVSEDSNNLYVYFIRTVPFGKSLNLSVSTDSELLFGEISSLPLQALHNTLSSIFLPAVEHFDNSDWKKSTAEQQNELVSSTRKFCKELREAVDSLSHGIQLRRPDPRFSLAEINGDYTAAARNPEVVSHFEELLEDWCRQIEKYLETSLDKGTAHADAGPRMSPKSRQTVFHTLRRCKQIDVAITEAFNEAKDNVKYLTTLERFVDPLYSGTPAGIMESLSALMNAITMIYSISRVEQARGKIVLFAGSQMIANCKAWLMDGDHHEALWEREPPQIIPMLQYCLKLNDVYHEQYRQTRERLVSTPKGKQLDVSEQDIFGRMDLFCRRLQKLITMYSTSQQFQCIAEQRFEGIDPYVDRFRSIFNDFKAKRHDLLDFYSNRFDRDFVEFSVRVSDLENALLPHISQIFETTSSIDESLRLLQKFQEAVYSENLKAELKGKINLIVHRYTIELVQIQEEYERRRANPPTSKDMPPIPSNIIWARDLLKKIEVAETLVEYELRWHQAWVDSVEATMQGLNCSLIARNPQTGKLAVNFDPVVAQLIREAKIMDRMDLEIPDAGRIVFMRENKLKHCYDELKYILDEYQRVSSVIRPVTASLLQKHLDSFEKRLSPGLTTLTWASLNIESFLQGASRDLENLNLLVVTVNDIVENRIESSIKSLSEIVLVELPAPGEVISLNRFVEMQEHHVLKCATLLNARSLEIENAVQDLIEVIHKQPLEPGVPPYSAEEENTLTAQYEWNLYKALLISTKRSLDVLRRQIFPPAGGRESADRSVRSIFEVDLQLDGTGVRLHPSIDEIQGALSRSAVAILNCSKCIRQWGTGNSDAGQQSATTPRSNCFSDRLKEERGIQRVLLKFLGSIQNIRTEVANYIVKFDEVETQLRSMEGAKGIGMLLVNTSAFYPQVSNPLTLCIKVERAHLC
ncbi:hypothetical protein Emed_003750 [Eimeria media]